MSLQSDLPSGVMPGEQPRSSALANGEMPGEEMPRGEMLEPAAIQMGSGGEMPRGDMSASGGETAGKMPNMPPNGGSSAGPGEMPLGLMTGEGKAASANAEEPASGIEIPGAWRLVFYPASR